MLCKPAIIRWLVMPWRQSLSILSSYLGRGSDIGSELCWCRRWLDASLTGPAERDIRFSGFSSQSGVPGREPSLDPGGDTGVFGAP